MQIRGYRESDATAFSQICLKTGDSGGDATDLYDDGQLLGYYYALPYAELHSDFTFVLSEGANGEKVVGYVVGVPDSETFGERCESDWFPSLRMKLAMPDPSDLSPDARILRLIFSGHPRENRFPDFPAHLHVDLLPAAQGIGWGRKLIETLLARMRGADVPGVHLGVGHHNEKAVGFYKHLGFEVVEESPAAIWMGMKLSS